MQQYLTKHINIACDTRNHKFMPKQRNITNKPLFIINI